MSQPHCCKFLSVCRSFPFPILLRYLLEYSHVQSKEAGPHCFARFLRALWC